MGFQKGRSDTRGLLRSQHWRHPAPLVFVTVPDLGPLVCQGRIPGSRSRDKGDHPPHPSSLLLQILFSDPNTLTPCRRDWSCTCLLINGVTGTQCVHSARPLRLATSGSLPWLPEETTHLVSTPGTLPPVTSTPSKPRVSPEGLDLLFFRAFEIPFLVNNQDRPPAQPGYLAQL